MLRFVSVSKKICVSVCLVTLWVRPPLCASVQLVTLWVRPPLMCVLSLEDNLRWILACYLLRFAAFLNNNLLPSSTELAGCNLRVLLTTCNSFGNCRCWEIWSAPLQKMVIKLSRDGHPPSPKWFPPSQECSPTIPRTITINCHDGHPLCQGLTHNIPKMVTH